MLSANAIDSAGTLFRSSAVAVTVRSMTSNPVSLLGSTAGVRVYPNPWRSDQHSGKNITFDHLRPGGTLKLLTVSGHRVQTLAVDSLGLASWDVRTESGDPAASGIYFYLTQDANGTRTRGKLAIIR